MTVDYCTCEICAPERDSRGIYCGYCSRIIIPFPDWRETEDVLLDVADELTRLRVENAQLKENSHE
jgi:hypothetical protein